MSSPDFEIACNKFREQYLLEIRDWEEQERRIAVLVRSVVSFRNFDIHSVTSRVKGREECIEKYERDFKSEHDKGQLGYDILGSITDLIGVRIVCLYEDEIYRIRDVIRPEFEVRYEEDKTAELSEEGNRFGYMGYHLDLCLKAPRIDLPEYAICRKRRFEVQIRTVAQDAWSVLDHKIIYKKNAPAQLKRPMNRLAALFELADKEFLRIRDETRLFEKNRLETALSETATEQEALLDMTTFLILMRKEFPKYQFFEESIDNFLQVLAQCDAKMTVSRFHSILEKWHEEVSQYAEFQWSEYGQTFNPYTRVRHMLFREDKDRFRLMLKDWQSKNFEKWLSVNAE